MRRAKKTYAVYHLTEKHTVFRLGKTKVKVSFTGGVVTKQGVKPATFTTDDPVVQMAIEKSDDFRKGNVKIIAHYPLDGEVRIGKNVRISDAPTPAVNPAPTPDEPQEDEAVTPVPEECKEPEEEPASEDPQEEEAKEEVAKEESPSPSSPDGLEVIEASCKDVAKQYLQEHFGENPAKLRTRDDVQKCAEKYGLTFNFI